MKFCANISTLCRDIPSLTERFVHLVTRKDFNFTSVECQNPYSVPLTEWQDLSSKHPDISWSLINSPPLFEVIADNRLPDRDEYEQLVLKKVIEYATGLKCSKVHLVMADSSNERMDAEIEGLISFACRSLQPHGITCLLEPLCTRPTYWLRSYDKAADVVKKVGHENLKLMLDTYHLQMLHGNVTANIQRLAPLSGHAQISQAPLRNSPDASGELNYEYVLKQLGRSYKDFVGLEYFSDSTESFSWLNKYADF